MRIDTVFIVLPIRTYSTTTHNGLADDEGRLTYRSLSFAKSLTDRFGTATIDLDDVPAPSLVLSSYIFAVDLLDGGRELDIIGVIVHDEVVKPKVSSDTTSPLRDLFLYPPVGDIGVDRLTHDPAKTVSEELSCDGCPYGEGVTLAERARGILYTTQDIDLRVPRRRATPLAELLQLLHRIATEEGQLGVEHGRHVPRVHEETVTARPRRCIGIEDEELREEDVDEVCAAHGSTWVTALSSLDHASCQDADVVSSTGH